MLDEGILKQNASCGLQEKNTMPQKKKPHKELLFYWSIQELECVVQGNSPSIVIIAICVLDVPSVFAVEGDVLLENNVAEYVPELQVFAISNIWEMFPYIGLPFPKEYLKICGASDRVFSAISFRPSHISRAGYVLLLGYYRNKSFRKREIMI